MTIQEQVNKAYDDLQALKKQYADAPKKPRNARIRLKKMVEESEKSYRKLLRQMDNVILAEKGIDATADVSQAISTVAQSTAQVFGSVTGVKTNLQNNITERTRIEANRQNVSKRNETAQQNKWLLPVGILVAVVAFFKLFK